jgi:alpha/beta superfamily hydrolase
MTNKVAHVLAKSFNDAGARAVRFNFRGVGASAGVHAEGLGETDDALAVLDWAAGRWPEARLSLAGFSFGGAVAIRAAAQRPIERLVTVAPAVQRVNIVDTGRLPTCPWLLVQGDRDELVNVDAVKRWVREVRPAPELEVLPGVDHFFHGRLNDLRAVVVRWLARAAGSDE